MTTQISGTSGVNLIQDGTIQTADFAAGVGPVFTKKYVSGDIPRTTNTMQTLTHGLGVAPALIDVYLVCLTAEHGWVAGDELQLSADYTGAASEIRNCTVAGNSTEIKVKITANTNGFVIISATTGAVAGIVPANANWALRVRAWA